MKTPRAGLGEQLVAKPAAALGDKENVGKSDNARRLNEDEK